MSDRPQSYVGVSGVSTAEQAHAILDMWPKSAPAQSLMLGVLTSQKVMAGGERNERSPAPGTIKSIFLPDGVEDRLLRDRRVLGLVHYFTKDTSRLGNQLLGAAACGSVGCHGVQVNVAWPSPEELIVFRDFGDYDRIVIQIGPAAMKTESTDVRRIAARVEQYAGLVSDVLIDASGGVGMLISPGFAAELVADIRSRLPELGIGIAGGICAETLYIYADMIREYGLSIDAEGRLRNETDELDLDKVRAYLNAAAKIRGWS